MQRAATGNGIRHQVCRNETRFDMTQGFRSKEGIFVDHEDVREHMGLDESLVLARRRVASSESCYESIKSFYDPLHAKKYARSHFLNRDKCVILFQVTSSRLQEIPL